MEFEDRCHKVQEPKFDCLLFGKLLLTCFPCKTSPSISFFLFVSFCCCLASSSSSVLLFTECKGLC
jgi:hypothetical protein